MNGFYEAAERLTRDGTPVQVPHDIPHGDMPGDKICIGTEHIRKAEKLLPLLAEKLKEVFALRGRAVVSVFGGSGVGKSEIASLLAWYLESAGIGAYVLSGDNYPRRIPMYNDAERVRVFRTAGLRALLAAGLYSPEVQSELDRMWEDDSDAVPAEGKPWLEVYRDGGRAALAGYLGTEAEQDYGEINAVVSAFRNGEKSVWLKRMGRTESERWYSAQDFSDTGVLIIEWTHGGSPLLKGVDVRILLDSTPEETREHRRLRARDGKTDSPFTTMVLEIEQEEIARAACSAALIMAKSGVMLRPAENTP